MRGWPATLAEGPVGLRPLRLRDASLWREVRIRNAEWLRPWEPTNPETPLFRSGIGPYLGMAQTMRREARQGLALPWVVTYEGDFAGQLTIGAIVWGSARSAQIGYWVDKGIAGRGVRPLFFQRRAASRRGEHPPGELRESPCRGKARFPRGRRPAASSAHRWRLARPHLLRADHRRCTRRTDIPLAGEHTAGFPPLTRRIAKDWYADVYVRPDLATHRPECSSTTDCGS